MFDLLLIVLLQIKVSLSHTGKCIRKYAVPNKTSLANSITLHFKTNATNQDMLLFLLANPNTVSVLSLHVERLLLLLNVFVDAAYVDV